MRLSVFKRLFSEDYQVPQDTKKWFEKFLGNINLFFDQVTTALTNNLTFQDNFRCEIKEIKFASNVEQRLMIKAPSALGVVVLQAANGAMVEGLSWRNIDSNLIAVTIKHNSSNQIACTLLVLF